jgi:long-subunit fatty acid transport protein
MKKCLYIVVLVFLLGSEIHGQGLLPRLGEQRVGTAAMTFLKIGIGARAVSMAGAFVPVANDASSLWWNPAGLVQINRNEAIVSHIQWPVDIRYEFAGYVHQISHAIAVGFSSGFLYTEDMEVTDEYHPGGTGEYFSYSDFFAAVSFSIRMTDRFSFGTTVKFAQENLADLEMRTFMIDFGTYYWTGFRSLRLAASMRNFGPNMRPEGTFHKRTRAGNLVEQNYADFSPPTSFTLGAAMEIFESDFHKLTLAFQMNHPMDNAENAVMGAEYTLSEYLAIRGGYRFDYGENHWTFGVGLQLPLGSRSVQFDYAYADFGRLDVSQQFTFVFRF